GRRRGEAGRVHGAEAAAQGQVRHRPGVSDDPHLDRQGDEERSQAAGVRAVGPAAAHVVLPEVEEGPQRIQGRRRLLPGGDPLLRRGREGQPDAGDDQGGRPQVAAREPVHEGLAREQIAVRRLLAGGFAALLAAWTGSAWAQDRPSEQDIFGGTAPKPATPGAPDKPTPAAPEATSPPAGANQPAGMTPPAAAAATEATGTERDRSVLGNTGGETQHLSDYQAPENPLQIGGQIYLRAQSTAFQGDYPDRWTLNAPSLVDAYFDARPNPRVRAFIQGRMSYNSTAPPSGGAGTTLNGLPNGNQGAFSGGSP